jgi:RHH-type rel operon transcriptional repressor/antitoxin RelB
MAMRSIRIPVSFDSRLDALSKKTGRTKTYYIQEMIRTSLADLEDYYLADAVSERLRAGKESVYPLEEVERDLGLDD